MTRVTESLLLDFCAEQIAQFNRTLWMNGPGTSDERAATALYLANTSWFGHYHELCQVAEQLHPGSTGHFDEIVRLTGFDPSRFRGRLDVRRAHEQSVS